MATWNATALFAVNPDRQTAKMEYLQSLLPKFDVIFLQEAHSSIGAVAAWRGVPGARYFGSHGDHGVGLLVSERFLQLFDDDPVLQDIVPGRVALLPLRGPHGALDLVVWYAPTGNARGARDDLRARVAAYLRPAAQVCTVIAGDFNHVARPRDRFDSARAVWSSHVDTAEEDDFLKLVADPIGLYEIDQHAPTHANAHGRSRIDRMYWNSHLVHQLDRTLRSGVLPWVPHLSAHRVLFSQ